MKPKIKYEDKEIGDVEVIADFLPSPDDLVFKDEAVKVTLDLSKSSVDFFKNAARDHHMQYQKVIRRLLDEYVGRQKQS